MAAPTAQGTHPGVVLTGEADITTGFLVAYGDAGITTWLARKLVLIVAPSIMFS